MVVTIDRHVLQIPIWTCTCLLNSMFADFNEKYRVICCYNSYRSQIKYFYISFGKLGSEELFIKSELYKQEFVAKLMISIGTKAVR